MKVKEALGRIRRNFEAWALAMDYDDKDELRLRLGRLERAVTEINQQKASKS